MGRYIWLVGLCLLLQTVYGQSSDALRQLLETDGLKSAAIGVSVKQVADGRAILAHGAEMALTPASVTKIIPTWFALQEKGGDYRWNTTVVYSGDIKNSCLEGDIIIRAGGDPTLESRYFPGNSFISALVQAIQKAGIRQIQGNIIVEGATVGTEIPGSWLWEDISNYYAALHLPFNYRDNTYVLQFRSEKPGTLAELTSVTPILPGIKIRNEVEVSAINKDNAWIFGGPYSTELYVKGTIPANQREYRVKGAMHDPAAVFVNELTGELKKNGIKVEKQACHGTKSVLLLSYNSPRLEEVVYYTNKVSINLFAESLGHLVASGHWLEEAKNLLQGAGIATEGVMLYDACGLSSRNAIPARVFTDLLVYIGQQNNGVFLRSLPVAGIDGGLTGYCYSYPALKNNLKAKTGSMSGIRCLSGYLTNRKGEVLAFTILINHYTCTTAQLQRAVGRFLNSLLE